MGLHPFRDSEVREDFEAVRLPLDLAEFHTYACDWSSDRVDYLVDGTLVRRVQGPPRYPLQLMLAVFDFPTVRSAGTTSWSRSSSSTGSAATGHPEDSDGRVIRLAEGQAASSSSYWRSRGLSSSPGGRWPAMTGGAVDRYRCPVDVVVITVCVPSPTTSG